MTALTAAVNLSWRSEVFDIRMNPVCLQRLPDGRISVQSEDATVRLVLHPHSKRFAVCFPLLVSQAEPDDSAGASTATTFTYFWQTQVFAEADHPSRWSFPLALALAMLSTPPAEANMAADASRDNGSAERPAEDQNGTLPGSRIPRPPEAWPAVTAEHLARNGQGNAMHSSTDAPNQESSLEEAFSSVTLADVPNAQAAPAAASSVLERTTHLPQAVTAASEGPNFFEEGSWWTACSLEPLPQAVRSKARTLA